MTRAWSPQQLSIFDWFATGRVPAALTVTADAAGIVLDEAQSMRQTPSGIVGEEGRRSQHLVVRARAGTGKTTTIVEGVTRAPERAILLAAFNKEIARELQKRVTDTRVEVKTLHALGLRYVKRNWQVEVEDSDHAGERALKLAKRAAPNAPEDVQKLLAKLHTKTRELAPFASSEEIDDIAYQFDILPSEDMESQGWDVARCSDAAYDAMGFATEPTRVVDYADMIFLPLAMRWVRPWFDLVVIDEAQDMTETQLMLAEGACKRNGRICVVGDDRQAIYGFRGADSGSLDRLKSKLHAAELGLTVTYRCGSLIVDLARELVPDFTAAAGAAPGEILRSDDEKMLQDVAEGDFVVSRKNAPLVKVCMALLKLGKRARIRGRDVGRGIVALIKRLKVRDVAAVPAALDVWVQRETAKATKLKSEEAREARAQYVSDQADVVLALCDGAATVSELESRASELFSDDESRGAVICGTVHKVKGLEASTCYLLEGTFRPGAGEEANIRYVAITRAKSKLVWVTGLEQ